MSLNIQRIEIEIAGPERAVTLAFARSLEKLIERETRRLVNSANGKRTNTLFTTRYGIERNLPES